MRGDILRDLRRIHSRLDLLASKALSSVANELGVAFAINHHAFFDRRGRRDHLIVKSWVSEEIS